MVLGIFLEILLVHEIFWGFNLLHLRDKVKFCTPTNFCKWKTVTLFCQSVHTVTLLCQSVQTVTLLCQSVQTVTLLWQSVLTVTLLWQSVQTVTLLCQSVLTVTLLCPFYRIFYGTVSGHTIDSKSLKLCLIAPFL